MLENNNLENIPEQELQQESHETIENELEFEHPESIATSWQNDESDPINDQFYIDPPVYSGVEDIIKSNKKEKPPKSKEDRQKRKMIVATVLLCAVISSATGFGGAMAADSMFGGSNVQTPFTQLDPIVATTKTGGIDVAAVAASTEDSVVEITTETARTGTFMDQYISEGAGSGVILSEDGMVVTNNHVISGAKKITVRLKNQKEYTAKLLGSDPRTDIALLKIEAKGLKLAVTGDSDGLKVGSEVVAIGNPLGELGGTVTNGIISALNRDISIEGKTMNLLQTNAAINPGNSGGGLFDAQGSLIGVVVAKSSGESVEGLGFAIPINQVKTVVEELNKNGYITGRVELGISVLDINDDQTAMEYNVLIKGVYVAKVNAGSDAHKAGLEMGDRILSVNGTEIKTASQVSDIIGKSKPGNKIVLKVARNSQEETITVTLTELKS